MSIAENLAEIKNQLPQDCRLVAVSKTHPPEVVLEAYHAGQKLFGENKVQELVDKFEKLPKDIEWHLIGHLQSNKAKYIVPFVHLIHSVDSEKLLGEINKQAQKIGRTVNCLLQVHVAREETKFGFDAEELKSFLRSGHVENFGNIKIQGLMGMATNTDDRSQISEEFKFLGNLFNECKQFAARNIEMKELSMGMSSDYLIAMAAGSTLVRVGSSIFGTRTYTSNHINK